MIKGKNILLGVCGSIAAYKAALIVRLFVQNGDSVRVIMTDDATDFISPLSLSTLSKNPVHQSFIANTNTGEWTNHVELGLWADVFVIAPATANTIAKLANGLCDNLLTATYLSAKCPVFVAPAMDLDMWKHQATQRNIQQLTDIGNHIIDVEDGELASGLSGKGRLAEPEHIFEKISDFFGNSNEFAGKQVLVTAGPTQEDIDPVRYITNHSTGTMGVEIANAFAQQGANVSLVLGPTSKSFEFHSNIDLIRVHSASDMFEAVDQRFDQADITVMSAAVADYTPKQTSSKKIKKTGDDLSIELVRTKDILQTMGKRKQPNQILVGFALETNDEIKNATKKLHNKNLDFIVLNSMNDPGAGFKHATNQVTIIDKFDKITTFELKSKREVAQDILNQINALQND